jgi:hypothetical protein
MDLKLAGKRALVTGASRGIGAAIVHALAAEGCDLILAAREANRLDELKAELQQHNPGIDVRCLPCDLRARGVAVDLSRQVGSVEILVNNAGDVPNGTLLEIDEERWRAAWDLKVFGYINLSREIYRKMIDARSGVIVNIIGIAADRPIGHVIASASGNAALVAFTKALGKESVGHGVRVVAVSPGSTETDRQITRWKARAVQELGDESRWRELTRGFPFGRLARADEIASVVAFLASEKASYMSATVVTVDGGLS